jgi:NAD(P)-dependent dehydrogenase (short-subunit alcohol dehydrogenase family)
MDAERPMRGMVALVTGASRGAGRGIAIALAEAGAKVYATGRSTRANPNSEGIAGTIEETAELVTASGGECVAVRCDHTVDSEVETLFQQLGQEAGRLDVLVNNVWGGYEFYEGQGFVASFWQQPLRHWDGMFTAGVRAHLAASRLAAPLMTRQRSGLIVGTTAWDDDKYLGNLFYDIAKAAVNRMAFGLGKELAPHGVTAVALAPGFMRTERVLAAHAKHPFDLSATETPAYIGRAVVALATDPKRQEKTGRTLTVGDLAAEYGLTDADGRRVPRFRIPG